MRIGVHTAMHVSAVLISTLSVKCVHGVTMLRNVVTVTRVHVLYVSYARAMVMVQKLSNNQATRLSVRGSVV